MNASNVGFRMLRNAGWNVGEGLGKEKQGATEPLRVVKRTSRRGVGGDDDGATNVVGERPVPVGAGKRTNPEPQGTGKQSGNNIGDAKRLKAACAAAFAREAASAFNDPSGPNADVNPLARRRAEGRGDFSENNPLRGLF
jgi:hypothetical protein